MSDDPVKQKHPDLIKLSPAEQLKKLPELPDDRCGRRNKACQTGSGGCGYRFPKGSKLWVCPKCGQDRRCYGINVEGTDKCRMHGGARGAGDPRGSSKYILPPRIDDNYRSLLKDPELLTLTQEVALLSNYTQELYDYLKDYDVATAHVVIKAAIADVEDAVMQGNLIAARKALHNFRRASDTLTIHFMIMREIKDNWNIQRTLMDTANKWIDKRTDSIPREDLYEYLLWWNRVTLKYIKNSKDRHAWGEEMLRLLPSGSN